VTTAETITADSVVRLAQTDICSRCADPVAPTGLVLNEYICLQPFDLEYPQSWLNPLDYYPDLGKKTLRICVRDELGEPATGHVTASLAPDPGGASDFAVQPAINRLDARLATGPRGEIVGGLAEFVLDAASLKKTQQLYASFNWDEASAPPSAAGIAVLSVRHNGNVRLNEVASGQAVYVATEMDRSSGIYLTIPNWDASTLVPGAMKVGHYLTSFANRRVDSIQVMLNQTVARHAKAIRRYEDRVNPVGAGKGNGLPEDGNFTEPTKIALKLFKQHFGFATCDNNSLANNGICDDVATTYFMGDAEAAIKEEYGLNIAAPVVANALLLNGGAFDPNSIVDDFVLVREGSFNAADRCFGQTSLVSPTTPCSSVNAGLLEIYENIVSVFVRRKLEAIESYVELQDPIAAGYWQSRPWEIAADGGIDGIDEFRQIIPNTASALDAAGWGDNDGDDTDDDADAAYRAKVNELDDGRIGVSYNWTGSHMTGFVARAFARNPAYWSQFTALEKGNVFEAIVNNLPPPWKMAAPALADVPDSLWSDPKLPGMTSDEYKKYIGPPVNPAKRQYRAGYWAGIDCSGMAWVAAEYAVRGDAALESWTHPRWVNYPNNLADTNNVDYTLGRNGTSVGSFVDGSLQRGDAAGKASPSNWVVVAVEDALVHHEPAADGVPDKSLRTYVRAGDLMVTADHVGTAYTDGTITTEGADQIWSIEAHGVGSYNVAVDTARFGRKVLIRDLSINGKWAPRIALREVIWQ